MFHYLLVLLDDTSTSFCYLDNPNGKRNLMPLSTLKEALLYALKNNLQIQIVYPSYEIPDEYKDLIYEVDHTNIVPSTLGTYADVVVLHSCQDKLEDGAGSVIIRDKLSNILASKADIIALLTEIGNVSLIVTDIENLDDNNIIKYESFLNEISVVIEEALLKGKQVQFANITDRLTLSSMNNCNAGWRSITVAPNGKFYLCPSFFFEDTGNDVGDIHTGVEIRNSHLLKSKYAPICLNCDAFQCKRCVWLNQRLTNELNTPSHQQCIAAHSERNASMRLLNNIRKHGEYLTGVEIKPLSYTDPIEIIINQRH